MINYNEPITREHLELCIYRHKFWLCDKLLNSDNPDMNLYRKLLLDETTFVYLTFKIGNERLTYYPHQDLIAQDTHRFIIFRAANQIGKSLKLDCKAARNLIIDHGFPHNEAICSISLKQAGFQMIRIKDLLNSAQVFDWTEEKGDIDNMSMISCNIKDDNGKVKYSNKLIVTPAGEGLLGFDLHEINLDEFEFWTDIDLKWFMNQIAEPRTYHTKGRVHIYSNPNGADSFVAELERLSMQDGNRKYHTYVFNFIDKPGNTENELEVAKLGKTRAEIESTLLAIRTLSDRNYFTPDEIERSYDPYLTDIKMVGKQPFFFLDVGAKHDRCFLVGGYVEYEEEDDDSDLPNLYIPIMHAYPVGYPLSRVVGSFSNEQDSDGWHYEKSVKEYYEEWSAGGVIPVLGVDVTGNSGIAPLLESVGISAVDTVFSGPAKSGFYQRFKWYMEKGLLHRMKNEIFDYEARHLEMKKSKRGYLQIHHEREDDLDDSCDAIAGLINLCDPLAEIRPSLRLF